MIEFLVATVDRTDAAFLDVMFAGFDFDHCRVLVINQCINIAIPESIPVPHEHVRVMSVRQRGTSRSRNLALEHAVGDICTFADDDLVYEPGVLDAVRRAFESHDDGVITFKTKVAGTGRWMKDYADCSFVHGKASLLRAGDWEIFFRRAVISGRIWLDERFGLGCRYPACEYHIFLMDAFKAGISCRYVPITVAGHPDVVSTGLKFEPRFEIARGAGFARMLGWLGLPAAVVFAVTKYRQYGSRHSFFSEMRYLLAGCLEILVGRGQRKPRGPRRS